MDKLKQQAQSMYGIDLDLGTTSACECVATFNSLDSRNNSAKKWHLDGYDHERGLEKKSKREVYTVSIAMEEAGATEYIDRLPRMNIAVWEEILEDILSAPENEHVLQWRRRKLNIKELIVDFFTVSNFRAHYQETVGESFIPSRLKHLHRRHTKPYHLAAVGLNKYHRSPVEYAGQRVAVAYTAA